MRISLSAVGAVFFVVMLCVLGHGAWHAPLTTIANLVVGLLTGGHATG